MRAPLALQGSRAIAAPLLTPQPIVQIGDAKAPVLADMPPWDLAKARFLLQRLGMHAQEGRRLDRVEERFEIQ